MFHREQNSPLTIHEKYNFGISRFAENKRTFWKITAHGDFGITIHKGNKKGRSWVTKTPFTTLIYGW